jgi:hypothetical protein
VVAIRIACEISLRWVLLFGVTLLAWWTRLG